MITVSTTNMGERIIEGKCSRAPDSI